MPIGDALETYYVNNTREAKEKIHKLTKRDLENKSVTDNVGGLEVLENGEWTDWECKKCYEDIEKCKCKIEKKPLTYHQKRYKEDEEFRKKIIASTMKYHHTKKGKDSTDKAHKKLIDNGYYKNYLKEKRLKAKENKICYVCFKQPMKVGVLCGDCYARVEKNRKVRENETNNR